MTTTQTAKIENKTPPTGLNQLEQLKKLTKVVADTGDFATLKTYAPSDATTNPSLIYKAAQMPEYKYVVDRALAEAGKSNLSGDARVRNIVDHLLVFFGVEILKLIPGRVSTETDVRLSFDMPGLVEKAHRFISLYEDNGVSRERVLIK